MSQCKSRHANQRSARRKFFINRSIQAYSVLLATTTLDVRQWPSPMRLLLPASPCAAEQQGLLLACTNHIWLWLAVLSVSLSDALYQSSHYYSKSQIVKPLVPRQAEDMSMPCRTSFCHTTRLSSDTQQGKTSQGAVHGLATC